MQKNIVLNVNAALAAEDNRAKDEPAKPARSEEFLALKQDIVTLKEENSMFAVAVEEMRAQNQELKSKIEELISNAAASRKTTKKKKNKQSKR